MTAPSATGVHETYIATNFHNFDDMQPSQHRYAPRGSTSYNQDHQHQTSKSGSSNFCSKQCLIGLGIGLLIGVLLVIIIAVPVGVTKKNSLGTISSTPNWIGTFRMDGACDTSYCCCLTNEVKLSKINDNQMQITGSLTGVCGSLPSTISLTESIPTDFQAYLTLFGLTYRFRVGQDNSYISSVNMNSARCSDSALRTSYNAGNMKSMNLGLLMFILFITVWTMI